MANEFDVRSALHRQVSLATVSQICVVHDAMNGCKNITIVKGLLQNVNINENDINLTYTMVSLFYRQ